MYQFLQGSLRGLLARLPIKHSQYFALAFVSLQHGGSALPVGVNLLEDFALNEAVVAHALSLFPGGPV
jgi:hypothetical protein